MKLRWAALAFTTWGVYTALIGKYGSVITSRFYETLSDPNMLYGVISPQPIMLLGFVTLTVLFVVLLLRYRLEKYYPEERGESK